MALFRIISMDSDVKLLIHILCSCYIQGVATKFPEWFYCKHNFYTYSLLRGVTFKILPLSSYILSLMMLPLLETFLELLLWNSYQCYYHIICMSSIPRNLRTFKADVTFGNSHKSFHFSNRSESALWAAALLWWRIQPLGQS